MTGGMGFCATVRRRGDGFTLIELMVSMVVLAVIVVMMAQMIRNTTIATSETGRNIDSDAQARSVFDRIEADLNGAIKRDDVDFYLNKQPGNDQMFFYSVASGYFPQGDLALASGTAGANARNAVALLGYRVNYVPATGSYALERLSRGLHWGDGPQTSGSYTSIAFLPYRIADCFNGCITDLTNTSTNLTTSQWDVIGDQIFRFELSYLLTSGTVSPNPNSSGTAATTWTRADVAAIVITVATMDRDSRVMLPNVATLSSLGSLLDDADFSAPNNPTTAEKWTQKITQNISSPPPGIPKAAMSAVRVYQRYFYLNGQQSNK